MIEEMLRMKEYFFFFANAIIGVIQLAVESCQKSNWLLVC